MTVHKKSPRTQAERSATTIAALVSATVQSIADRGYAATTIDQIISGAGTSRGGLFRHFPTRLDIIAAATQEALDRQIQSFIAAIAEIGVNASVRQVLTTFRNVVTNTDGAVLREVAIAARTDDALRARVQNLYDEYYRVTDSIAEAIPFLKGQSVERRRRLNSFLVALFHGEAIWGTVQTDQTMAAGHLELLMSIADAVGLN